MYTSIMCPVEMSMLDCAGSSHQEGVLLCELGLGWGASLNCDETLLTRDVSVPPPPPPPAEPAPPAAPTPQSCLPREDLAAMCCRQRSCGENNGMK